MLEIGGFRLYVVGAECKALENVTIRILVLSAWPVEVQNLSVTDASITE